jgi:peptide/nickel transport system permease protein
VTALAAQLPIAHRQTAVVSVSRVARRLAYAGLVLIAIAFLSYWGLTMAEQAVASLPVEPLASAVEAARLTAAHFLDHPTEYIVHREAISPWLYVATLLRNSLVLLIPAILVALVAGVPLGMRAARSRTRRAGSLIWMISLLGVSVPAFMLAMFLWAINIQASRFFHWTPLPGAGLGFDQHLMLPVLVLAARPFAMLTQVTYVTIGGLLDQDFVRTARGKGVSRRDIDRRHVMRNAWIPILTAVATSLRFSLATLPIVEYFFVWPGIGLGLLEAIIAGEQVMVVDMVLALGVVFLTVNLVLEVVYPLLDPRMRGDPGTMHTGEQGGLGRAIVESFERQLDRWRRRIAERRTRLALRGQPARGAPVVPLPSNASRPPPAMREQLAARSPAPEWARRDLSRLIEHAKIALGHGDRPAARRLARGAVRLDPGSEAAWLTLAAVSTPRSALAYASRALDINPNSRPARRAIQWAVHQLPREERHAAQPARSVATAAAPHPRPCRSVRSESRSDRPGVPPERPAAGCLSETRYCWLRQP